MARDSYLEHIAAVPIFAGCTRAQLQEIARVADELTVPEGTVLARQGAVGSEFLCHHRGDSQSDPGRSGRRHGGPG